MKEITENNTLLAEFLGSELEEAVKSEKVYCLLMPDENDISGFKKEFFAPDELKFHKSWDWLMLVVDKIESLENVFAFYITFDKYIKQSSVVIHPFNNSFTKVGVYKKSKIEAIYTACIEFVKWFNSQNK